MNPDKAAALRALIERRTYVRDSPDWEYRTRAAWTMLQMSMNKPPNQHTRTPPRVTVRG